MLSVYVLVFSGVSRPAGGQETHATGFSYSVSGKADYGIDLSGPGYAGKVTGKEIGVNTPYALGFNLVFWPNVTAAAAAEY